MENQLTTEQKARVFAEHIGQQVIILREMSPAWLHSVNFFTWRLSVNWGDSVETYSVNSSATLILRPLSAITDEDAIEVAKMYYGRDTDYAVDTLAQDGKRFVLRSSWCENGEDWFFFRLLQFLIQRGYAVPLFIAPGHPLNGKTAIEMGLAIDATTL